MQDRERGRKKNDYLEQKQRDKEIEIEREKYIYLEYLQI